MGLVSYLLWNYMLLTSQPVAYKSEGLQGLSFESDSVAYSIYDDSQNLIKIYALRDQHEDTYWYRHVDTEVCQTGDCKRVNIGIYWNLSGDFKGLEVYIEPLTKTDHSDFKPWDYSKLMSILKNDWSILREYKMEELTDQSDQEVDGKTGATKKEISDESVEDAVYTTYTLWHLIHQGEKEQLAVLSSQLFSNISFQKRIINSNHLQNQQLLLEQYTSGNIPNSNQIEGFILKSLSSGNEIALYQAALKALAKTPANGLEFQNKLGEIYRRSSISQKVPLLASIKLERPLSNTLYSILSQDLALNNDWLTIKILSLLKYNKVHTNFVLESVEQLQNTTNPLLKDALSKIIN